MFRSTDTFIGKWRALLFNSFIFAGGVVLISLLIAILSDVYDSVKLKEPCVLVKDRASIVASSFCSVFRRFLSKERTEE